MAAGGVMLSVLSVLAVRAPSAFPPLVPSSLFGEMGRQPYARTPTELLRVQCWCRCGMVAVPADAVRQGRTESCGRRMCNALEFTALMASGNDEPCDCREREGRRSR